MKKYIKRKETHFVNRVTKRIRKNRKTKSIQPPNKKGNFNIVK